MTIASAVSQVDLFETIEQLWAECLALKLHSARRLAVAAWPHLKQTKGAIVITSDTSATAPKAALAMVDAIHAAILALAEVFADRGLTEAVRVNSVSPGPVVADRRRPMLKRYAASKGLQFNEAIDAFRAGNRNHPLREPRRHR